MLKRQLILKLSLLVVFLMSFSSALAIGYAYWDDLVQTDETNLSIGDWGTPIATAQDFFDFAMKADSTSSDRYYLLNDIDFTGFSWTYNYSNKATVFRGTLDGNGKTLSHLTIYHNSSSYNYLGIFPKMQGGSVYNLTLSNVYLDLGDTALNGTATRAGLITGNAFGLTNTISNITIEDSGVRGTSSLGAGGLVGSVTTSSTVVIIDNIKATNLRIFNKSANTGGIIGSIATSGATVTINDIDIQGEVYSASASSYTGGIVGRIKSGGKLTVHRAMVEMSSQNTLEILSDSNSEYSNRYLGGFIGYNLSSSDKVQLTDVFFTGMLYTNKDKYYNYVGTAIGRSDGSQTLERYFYSLVYFRSSTGGVITDPDLTAFKGINAQLVNASSLPSPSWWDTFSIEFNAANDLWGQDETGRLFLIRN